MQATACIVNWNVFSSISDPDSIVDKLLDYDGDDSDIVSCYDILPHWWDSGAMWQEIADILHSILKDLPEGSQSQVVQGVFPIISFEETTDELNLSPASDGCYFASLGPSKVKELASIFDTIDFEALAIKIEEQCTPHSRFNDIEAGVKKYFKQWEGVLKYATGKEWGVICHIG